MFSPGNWQRAQNINAVGQRVSGGPTEPQLILQEVVQAIPGPWGDIAQRLENGGDEDIGRDIVTGGLGMLGRAGLPGAGAAGRVIDTLLPSKRKYSE